MMRIIEKTNRWVSNHSQSLAAWASLITVISLPLAIIGLCIGYFQIKDLLMEPSVELEFVHTDSVAYMVKNTCGKTVENALVSFGIFDIDGLGVNKLQSAKPVQIPSRNYDYVNKKSQKGPFSLFDEYGTPGHRYFGIVYIGCKGCSSTETYWLYVKHRSPGESYYAKRIKEDTYQLNAYRLTTDTDAYLDELVPKTRRIYIHK